MAKIDKYKIEKQQLIDLASRQQMAASNPEESVWVEASAGTGKTKVLSDRVLRLLLAKVNPAKILCLTYTKAAAVEMSERIAKRLSLWAVENEKDLKKELSGLLGEKFNTANQTELLNFARTLFAILLDTPGGMKIQTIHSFCQDVLKRFPLEAGISPYFDVMDDRSSKEILQRIQIELLKQTDAHTQSPLALAVSYLTQNVSEFKFPEIMNMITVHRSRIDAMMQMYHNDISQIIIQLENKLGVSQTQTEYDIKAQAMQNINRLTLKMAMNALAQGGKSDIKNAEIFAKVGECHFAPETYDWYREAFFTQKGTIREKLATKPVVKLFPEIIEFMQQEAEKLLATDAKIKSLRVLQSTVAVLHIAKNIIDNYHAYKELYSCLDYEDLIILTRKLLENKSVADWVLFKLDGGIEHILIDEAQDTSPNQWAIIRALTQEFFAGLGLFEADLPRSVFVVGDRKQSIYSFQGADPKEFDKMYHYFEQQSQHFSKVQLDVSFRSTKAIMDCVNTLFSADCAKKGVIPDGEHINHRPFRLGDGGKVEVLPLMVQEKNTDSDDYNWKLPISREQKTSVSAQLARSIAQHIKTMVESGEILASQNRPVRYGDFMFLVQQRKNFVDEFVRACKDIGVNVAGVDKLKLLEQIAVQDLISLGKFLLLPSDDLSLAEILKSPLFGLDDDDLFTLCYQRQTSLFNQLLKNPEYAQTADKLKELLNMAGFARPFELYNHLLSKMNGRQNFISRMGIEVEDVLDEFINLTLAFEQNHIPSFESFISWIEQDEVVIKKEMEQGDSNSVKIMTVHGSKGLQAPIVILADTTKIKNKSRKSEFLWDNDNLVYFPTSADCYDENCTRIKNENLEADFDEYRRLLYVALTRAEDRLYIAGFSKSATANENSWYTLLANNMPEQTQTIEEDKRLVYHIEQENIFENIEVTQAVAEAKPLCLADFCTMAPVENPLARPYAPSRDDNDELDLAASPLEDSGRFYRRGTAIHKLLQYIHTIDTTHQEAAIISFLEKQLPEFPLEEYENIAAEIIRLCQTYPHIFQTMSMAEVPIIGELEGKIISAKVDRLIITDDKVIVVDYKTNRPAAHSLADVPEIYRKQMDTYQKLLQKIYPDKIVETYLLWTNTCNMMKI